MGGLHEGSPPVKRARTEGEGGLTPTGRAQGREGDHVLVEQGRAPEPPAAGEREGPTTTPALQQSNIGTSPGAASCVPACASGPDGASGLLTRAASAPFELLAALQPLLEGALWE